MSGWKSENIAARNLHAKDSLWMINPIINLYYQDDFNKTALWTHYGLMGMCFVLLCVTEDFISSPHHPRSVHFKDQKTYCR